MFVSKNRFSLLDNEFLFGKLTATVLVGGRTWEINRSKPWTHIVCVCSSSSGGASQAGTKTRSRYVRSSIMVTPLIKKFFFAQQKGFLVAISRFKVKRFIYLLVDHLPLWPLSLLTGFQRKYSKNKLITILIIFK